MCPDVTVKLLRLSQTLEQSGIVEDEAVLIHGKLGSKAALDALETVEQGGIDGGVALIGREDGQVGHGDVAQADLRALAGLHAEPPDRQGVGERSGLDVDIDAALEVRPILLAKFRLGLFERRYSDPETIRRTVCSEEHRALALEAARKSIVLLKNDGSLPLRGVRRLLLTGPDAADQSVLGDWVRFQPDANVISIGARMHSEEEALEMVRMFLATPFSGDERHARRIRLLAEYEASH